MEEPLLAAATGTGKNIGAGEDQESPAVREVKKQLYLAGPLVAGFLLQNLIQMVSVMFVGHLGELALASASLATAFAGVTGFSLLVSKHLQLPLSLQLSSRFCPSGSGSPTGGVLVRQAWRAAWTRCAGRPSARVSTTCSASTSSGQCWWSPW